MSEQAKLVAGPRQTVARVIHPQRGPGIAVRSNGPSFYQPDGGEPIAMRVGWGGCSAETGSYIVLHDPKHGRVEAKSLTSGEIHTREWSPLLGLGWLVCEDSPGKGWWHRFEGDDGRVTRFRVGVLSVGTPDYVRRSKRAGRKHVPLTPEEEQWRTHETRDGNVLAFRRGGPPAPEASEPAEAPAGDPRQLGLFGGTP